MPEVERRPTPMDAPAAAKVTLPPTEAERKAKHFAGLPNEDDEARSARRAKELATLFEVHKGNVFEAHNKYPTPPIPFVEMEVAAQNNWNEKRKEVDMANRAYNIAVRRACIGHRDEDIHLAKLRDTAKPTA